MSKFIVGGGISGLVWKFYNPEFTIITPQLTKPNTTIKPPDPFVRSGMIWLHDTPQTRQLLIDLGWKNPEEHIRKSKIGYYDNGVIRDKLSPTLKDVLVKKKMTKWDEEIKPLEYDTQDSARLSLTGNTEGANFMNVLTVDHGEIIYRLSQRCETQHGYVGVVRPDTIGITNQLPGDSSSFVYSKFDTLVSTMPAHMFYRAMAEGQECEIPTLESLAITFAVFRKKPKQFDGDYEMIYYDHTVPYTRMSHLYNRYCVEFTGDITREQVEEIFSDIHRYLWDYWQIPHGRIFSQRLTPPKNVIYSGRFATWNHSVTTEHVIQEAMEYARRKPKAVG
jgi:hypothetical protein